MAEQLTPEQALAISKKLRQSAADLRQYRIDKAASLTSAEAADILDKETDLRLQAQDFAASSICCTLADLNSAIDQLTAGISTLKKTEATLDTVRKGIGAATTLISLGAAVASGNPAGIAKAIAATAAAFPRTSIHPPPPSGPASDSPANT